MDYFDYSKLCFVIMPFGRKEVQVPAPKAAGGKPAGGTGKSGKAKSGAAKGAPAAGERITIVIDFDSIYKKIFEPAINAVRLPEGGSLVARRADDDFLAGNISTEMFAYIEYSRFAVADITGLNPNVFYELGVRHRARETGTAIFRIADAPLPFDINQIRAFPYAYEPRTQVAKSRDLIT